LPNSINYSTASPLRAHSDGELKGEDISGDHNTIFALISQSTHTTITATLFPLCTLPKPLISFAAAPFTLRYQYWRETTSTSILSIREKVIRYAKAINVWTWSESPFHRATQKN